MLFTIAALALVLSNILHIGEKQKGIMVAVCYQQ
jgi:hypothetical protein